ncbi:MAG: hypothetical protein WAW17_08225 [Rhodococcus sp. (in: high G+C Gram-positive bacteria)]|uniref:hypothetical protein n=1 Tax=Rhodococcus sp. TaxID=1831 RepID=UPI003BAFDF19
MPDVRDHLAAGAIGTGLLLDRCGSVERRRRRSGVGEGHEPAAKDLSRDSFEAGPELGGVSSNGVVDSGGG